MYTVKNSQYNTQKLYTLEMAIKYADSQNNWSTVYNDKGLSVYRSFRPEHLPIMPQIMFNLQTFNIQY